MRLIKFLSDLRDLLCVPNKPSFLGVLSRCFLYL